MEVPSQQQAPSPARVRALFKSTPEDFQVDELDAYAPTGDGPHVLVRIRKRSLTTDQAMHRLAEALRIERREMGAAGQKDKDAVTTQRLSLTGSTPAAVLALAGRWPDLEILEAAAHRNKLKPGHLRGNRFRIRLRAVAPDEAPLLCARLEALGRQGFPNFFGPQRFGRDGDNADVALAAVRRGRLQGSPHERRMLFSALQSRWFNQVLQRRIDDGTWCVPQPGDLLKRHDSGGLFLCDDAALDCERAARLEVSPTGPMFGADMRSPGPDILAYELRTLEADQLDLRALGAFRAVGEGTRRVLRELISALNVQSEGPDLASDTPGANVLVQMELGKGVYATTVLGLTAELRSPGSTRGSEPDSPRAEPT